MTAAQRKAALGLLVTIAYAEGFSQQVFDWLETTVRKHRLFSEMSLAEFAAVRSEAAAEYQRGPRNVISDGWAREVPREWAMPLFELAIEAVLLDGRVADIERKGLLVMAGGLGLTPADFNAAVERITRRKR